MFRFRCVADKPEKSYGLMLRFLGIDFCLLFLGWLDDWVLIDFRIPVNRGGSLQVGFLFLAIGRLPDDSIFRG